MDQAKQFYKSKRFWSSLVTLITAVGLVVTGDDTWQQQMPEILTVALVIISGFFGLSSSTPVGVGSKVLGKSNK